MSIANGWPWRQAIRDRGNRLDQAKLEEQKKILGNQIETESRNSYEQVAQILQLRQKILKDLIDGKKYLINSGRSLSKKTPKGKKLEKAIKEGKIEKTELVEFCKKFRPFNKKMAGSPKLKELQNECST